MAIRTIFMGTSAFAVPILEALVNCNFVELLAVITQPDKPAGRNLRLQPPPTKQIAINFDIPVLQPEKARDPEFIEQLKEFSPHLIVVAAYGQILPQSILDIPPFGCLNVHASLLPKYRGAAPIQWAIINGETETGVTIMKIDAGLDSGPILTKRVVEIQPDDTAQTLHDKLAQAGSELLIETIPPYINGKITPQPQDDSQATYAPKIQKEHAKIDWSLPSRDIINRIRAFNPWPVAYTFIGTGGKKTMLKIWSAIEIPLPTTSAPGSIIEVTKEGFKVACGKGAILVTSVQPENSRIMTAKEYLAGHKLEVGTMLE
jgi:methionyl-tRNA formyltransferase